MAPVRLFGVTRTISFVYKHEACAYGERQSTFWTYLERNWFHSEEIQSHPMNLLAYVRAKVSRQLADD